MPRLIWSSVVMIESEQSWKHVSMCELESYNYKFPVWLKQKEKVKRPKKIKYVRYICICDWMNVKFEETITLHCDVRPDDKRGCLHAHDTHAPWSMIRCCFTSRSWRHNRSETFSSLKLNNRKTNQCLENFACLDKSSLPWGSTLYRLILGA